MRNVHLDFNLCFIYQCVCLLSRAITYYVYVIPVNK